MKVLKSIVKSIKNVLILFVVLSVAAYLIYDRFFFEAPEDWKPVPAYYVGLS